MSRPSLLPELESPDVRTGSWMVTIYNNDHTAYEVVVFTLMAATGCDEQEAQIETWEAHHYGKAAVHFSSQKECEEVATIISSVGVQTEVTPEWPD